VILHLRQQLIEVQRELEELRSRMPVDAS